MIVHVYLTMSPGGDRPYFSHHQPAEDRMKLLRRQGAKVYAVDILVPGWSAVDGKIEAVAAEITDAEV